MKKRIMLFSDKDKIITDGQNYGDIFQLAVGETDEKYYEITKEEYEEILKQEASNEEEI